MPRLATWLFAQPTKPIEKNNKTLYLIIYYLFFVRLPAHDTLSLSGD